ncbi:hypothetical protein C5L31_000410 [Secundilactobacillus malefermentans]|uniref:HTH marR-type domain-containing protein n=2 Tax=Secundilactobacillus malefermentans TaxID=176292 RepID=A0A4R5NCM9_9LACO|nr:MarR family transcriptional regulator [Secundilactobacillus malefermentans]KRM56750.1 transcriptional regulator [Secundilactobacillus malefermentans DSM 5705 = KCTC 3548]TDG70842.1 hypothetical protein C5L31_000410 [Secundilactobacillus malefermentans]
MKKDEVDTFIKSIDTVSHKIDLYVSDQLKDLGLTPSTYFVILKIGAYGELTQEQLFQMLSINPSNVTRRLNRLIEVGYVSKKQSTDDKRRRLVKLT